MSVLVLEVCCLSFWEGRLVVSLLASGIFLVGSGLQVLLVIVSSKQVLQFFAPPCARLLDCYIFSFVPLTAFYNLPKLQTPTSLSFSLPQKHF